MIRVLVWATHLQTDILALALHLDACEDVALMVVTPGLATFRAEPIARACPFAAPLLDRDDPDTPERARRFGADVVVADNHVAPPGLAPRLFYMWHGLGWKARGRLDLRVFYHQVRRLTGIDPRRPNPAFRAQCYGPHDRAWRMRNWHLPADACAEIGMTFSDLLLDPPYDKRAVAKNYRIDVIGRPTVLLAITWHYGGIFSAAGSAARMLRGIPGDTQMNPVDLHFLNRMVETVRARGANLLICLHDRKRYDAAFLHAIEALVAPHSFVEVRFKDRHPDNLSDLLVADVMVSNLSSFLAYHYVLRRPAVHIRPADPDVSRIERRIMLFSRFPLRLWSYADDAWMLDPTDVAGPIVRDAEEAAAAVAAALADPESGREATGEWLARHVTGIDGKTAARFKRELERLCAAPAPGTPAG